MAWRLKLLLLEVMIGCTVNAFGEDPFGFRGIRRDLLECGGVLYSFYGGGFGLFLNYYIKEGFIGLFISILYTISEKCLRIPIEARVAK